MSSVIAYGQSPLILSQSTNTTVILGQSATFIITATNASTYQWFRDNIPITGATNASFTLQPTLTDGGHTYTAGVASSLGYAFSSPVWLHVTPRNDLATVSNIENFGVAQASDVSDSFGLGVDSYQDWEFSAVAAMGGKWVRTDGCNWEQVETQIMPGNTSGGINPGMESNCVAAVTSAHIYGLHLDSIAYWAPPQSVIAKGTTTNNVAAGSTSLPLTLTSGDLSGYDPKTMLVSGVAALSPRIDAGSPVDSISGTTLTLTEASNADIPSGTPVVINALLYPPVLLQPQAATTSYVSNSSIQAWTRYVYALESYIQAMGVTGTVELWNEPEQSNELWDYAPDFYASPPPHLDIAGTGSYLAFASAALPPVDGVRLLNGWTDVTGYSSLYNPVTLWALPAVPSQVNRVFLGEAIHPYGNNPEQTAWLPGILQHDAISGVSNFFTETPIGGQVGASFKLAALFNREPAMDGGLHLSITETGVAVNESLGQTEVERTRFYVRQFLTFTGLHVYPIIFYKAAQDPDFAWFGSDTLHTPLPVVAVFSGLLSDVAILNIGKAGSRPLDVSSPVVEKYLGYYPLATTSIVGTRSGDKQASVLFFTWQKSYTVPPGGGTNSENYGTNGGAIPSMPVWLMLPSPAPVPLVVRLPHGYTIGYIKNVVTRQSIDYTLAGDQLTYLVADDPLEVLVIPQNQPAPTIVVSNQLIAYGKDITLLSAVITSGGGSPAAGILTFKIGSGPGVAANCFATTSSTQSCTASYPTRSLMADYYSIIGSMNVDGSTATGIGRLVVTMAVPVFELKVLAASLNNKTAALAALLLYTGSSAPSGTVTFQVNPNFGVINARCTGNSSPLECEANYPLDSVSAGTSVVTISLAGDRNYTSASQLGTLITTKATASILIPDLTVAYGSPLSTLSNTLTYVGATPPDGALTISIDNQPGIPSSCTGSKSPQNCVTSLINLGLLIGSYPIEASLSEGPRYQASTSRSTLTVIEADFSFITISENQASSITGQPASFRFDLSSSSDLNISPVSFTVSGLPESAVASFSPYTINLTGVDQSVIMTISSQESRIAKDHGQTNYVWPLMCISFFPFCFLRPRNRTSILLLLFTTLLSLNVLTGCADIYSASPTSTYTLTVTATSGLIHHSQLVTLRF